jgi:hypothetical protein
MSTRIDPSSTPIALPPASIPHPPTSVPQGIGSTLSRLQEGPEEPSKAKPGPHFSKILQEIFVGLLKTILKILESLLAKAQGSSPPQEAALKEDAWKLPATPLSPPITSTSGSSAAVETPATDDPFIKLTLTEEHQRKIFFIVHTVAEAHKQTIPVLALAQHKSQLEQYGENIKEVHPLKFLEYILRHPVLVKDLRVLQEHNSMLTWKPFIEGAGTNLAIEANAGRLFPCIKGFAHALKMDPKNILPYVQSAKWEEMVRFLTTECLAKAALPAHPLPTAHRLEAMPITQAALPSTEISAATPSTSASSSVDLSRLQSLLPSTTQQAVISDIFSSVANQGYFDLAADASRLKGAWAQLSNIHPLGLLTHLFSTPQLVGALKTISQDRLKWWGLQGDLVKQLKKGDHPIDPYKEDFADFLQIHPSIYEPILDRDWRLVLKTLIRSKCL